MEVIIVDSLAASCPGPVAKKQAKTITPPPPCPAVWGVCADALSVMDKYLHFFLICRKKFVQEVLHFFFRSNFASQNTWLLIPLLISIDAVRVYLVFCALRLYM